MRIKSKRARTIIVTVVFLLTAIGAPLSAFADNSDASLAGASYAAKIYYYALYSCAKTKINYNTQNWETGSGRTPLAIINLARTLIADGSDAAAEQFFASFASGVSAKSVNEQNLFTTGDSLSLKNYIIGLGMASFLTDAVMNIASRVSSNTNVGIIIGVKEGGQDDGAMLCGRGNNAMIKSAVKYFDKLSQKRGKGSITIKDIACDYSDPSKPGIFAGDKDGTSGNCGAIFDSNDDARYLYVADGRLDYLDRFAKEKLGYSQDELLNLTNEELYYIYFWSFDLYCATPNEGGDYPNVNALITKDSDGAPVPASYGKTNYQSISESRKTKTLKLYLTAENDGGKVKIKDKAVKTLKNGDAATCDNIYKILSDDDNEITKAFSEYVQETESEGDEIDSGEPISSNTDWCSSIDNALAWLVCPMIEMLRDTATNMYDNMIEPLLVVEDTLLGRGQKSVYDAWSTFRSAANVLLIIALLVIIFSQLTGVGIDNYGIKKTLPKLIIAALLINLSYIICQILVDLSNLSGYGLNAVFDNLSNNLVVTGYTSTAQKAGGVATGVAVVSGTVAAVAGAAYLAPELLVAAIPGIIGTLIAAIIAIFFFFFLLGARKAGIILLVALSPLAFACYMLPNTKKLFEKWKKMFMGLLLMYPIAGALIGGGNFAAKLLLSLGSNNFWLNLCALLIAVVPFFFLPTILKNSFTAIGNIGNKISGLGRRVGGRLGGAAGNALKNSNLHQANLEATKRRGAENRNKLLTDKMKDRAVKNGNYKTKDGKKANSFDELSDEEKLRFNKDHRGLARRSAADNSIIAEDDKKLAERGAAMGSGFLAGSAAAAAQQAGEKGRDIDEQTGETISAYDVDAFDENGNKVLDENGNQKKQKAIYDKKSDSWKVDTGKKDAAGNAIYRNVNKSQMDEIKKAQFGSNPNKVRIGENGEKEFTLNKDTGKYEHNGVVATDDEMKEINDNLAKGQMLQNYTRRNGRGAFTDSLGNTLEGGEGIAAAGFSQSWADLQRTKAAKARAQTRGSMIGGYAGQSSTTLSNAAQLNAENEGMSRTNTTLGQADALRDLQGLGYNTATSRISASQAAGTKLTETMKGNVGAMEIERTAGVQALMTTVLTVNEKDKLATAAQAGKLESIIKDSSSSEGLKKVAREMLNSGKDYSSLRPDSSEINQDINSIQTKLLDTKGTIISTSEREQLIHASEAGTESLQKIVNSDTASSAQKSIARAMIASGTDYSSFGSTPQGSQSINNSIKEIENVMMNGGSELSTEQKEKLVRATKAGQLETQYLNNNNVSMGEKYVAQKILDAKANDPNIDFSQNGYGSQFIKGIIDKNSGFASVADFSEGLAKTIQPPAEGVLSIGRTAGQVTNAINAGSTKLVNQFEGQIAGEKVGEVRVDRAVAEHQTQNARTVKEQEQAAYAEALTNEDLWEKDENGNIKRSEDGTPVSLLTVKEERAKNQAQRRIFTTAAQNMLDRTSPDFSTIISDVAIKRKNDEIKAREASIYNDPSNISDSVDALYNKAKDLALKGQRGEKYDEAELRAYINVMVKKGEPGEEAANDLLRLVAPKEGEVPSDVQRTIASHLINNYGSQLKNTSRSTHDYAQAVLSAAAKGTPISYDVDQKYSTNVNSLKAESFTVMNDKEAERLLNALKGENGVSILTAKEAQTLVNKTDEALKNETIRGKLKGKVEDVMKEIISLAATSQSERGFKWAEKSKNPSQGQPEASQPTPDTTSYDNPAGTSSDSTF